MNIFFRWLKNSNLLSMDLIYRMYFMQIFGSKLYFGHKVSSFRSCAFCKNLYYDKLIRKYVCSNREYEACNSLIPCIIPDTYNMFSVTCIEEDNQIPWLFKEPCLNFDVLDFKNYFRNFVSIDLNRSVIMLEALEGVLTGQCAGNLPCHICACVNKELYSQCSNLQNAKKSGKCSYIYYKLNKCFCTEANIAKISRVS